MFSLCSKTLNVVQTDWKLFSKSSFRNFLTFNTILSCRVFEILLGVRKEKKFPVSLFHNSPKRYIKTNRRIYLCENGSCSLVSLFIEG